MGGESNRAPETMETLRTQNENLTKQNNRLREENLRVSELEADLAIAKGQITDLCYEMEEVIEACAIVHDRKIDEQEADDLKEFILRVMKRLGEHLLTNCGPNNRSLIRLTRKRGPLRELIRERFDVSGPINEAEYMMKEEKRTALFDDDESESWEVEELPHRVVPGQLNSGSEDEEG